MSLSAPLIWSAVVLEVHDGDTIKVDIDLNHSAAGKDKDLGFHVKIQSKRLHLHDSVRLYGLNAAELITPAGKAAQQALVDKLPVGSLVILTTWLDKNDKYGRVLAGVKYNGEDINQWLIDNGWAAAWDGTGPKPVPGGIQ